MKVSIIGGGGRVGSCAAFALQCAGLVTEIQILDANKDMAEGEALDLLHGNAFAGEQRIYPGDYARAADSDLFLITAGLYAVGVILYALLIRAYNRREAAGLIED